MYNHQIAMKDFAQTVTNFRQLVETVSEKLMTLPADLAMRKPAPDKWSAAEIVGHLIDSAANNHVRFVHAQAQEDLVLAGYDQEQWVATQDYQNASWPLLVQLWRAYNLHLAHVMASVPEAVRTRPRLPHTLDRVAWQTVAAAVPVTLEYLMRDYIGHLQNHLRQLPGG
jgi:hypothetical protein